MFAGNGNRNAAISQSRGKITAGCRNPAFTVNKTSGINQLLRGGKKSVIIIH
jgi:hypothetical protein